MRKFFLSLSILSGTIIGAGIFSLPYIALKSGFWTILFYLFFLGGVVIVNHLFLGEISLKTKDFLRLPSFVGIYLGKKSKNFALFSYIFGLWGCLLVYLILGGDFLCSVTHWGVNLSVLIYFLLGSLFIYFGIKTIDKIEFSFLFIFVLILILIFLFNFHLIKRENFIPGIINNNFFLPYGPVLFSLWGATLIPELEEFLRNKKNLLKKIIPLSIILAVLIYIFFIVLVLGICGSQTSPSALSSLSLFLKGEWGNFLFVLGVITTFTSFIVLGLTLKKIFLYDLKKEKNISFFLTVLPPFLFYFLGFKNFIGVLSFIGAVFIGIEGILINLIYQKIHPQRKFLTLPLILIFILGIVYQFIKFLF